MIYCHLVLHTRLIYEYTRMGMQKATNIVLTVVRMLFRSLCDNILSCDDKIRDKPVCVCVQTTVLILKGRFLFGDACIHINALFPHIGTL